MQENKQEVKEISFKDRLIQIYTDLDNINIEEVQNEIDEIKNNLKILIETYKLVEEEKNKILFNELIENKNQYRCLHKCHKKTKPTIIKKASDEREFKQKSSAREWITIGLLLVIIVGLGICLAISFRK